MNHGQAWVHSARDPEPNTSMHRMSAEWSVPYAKIVENDLGLIASTLVPVKDELDRQFASNIYSVVGAAADRVGNVVEAKKAGSFAESMLEMLEKIELGVDREGNVSMPQIHAGPDAYEKIVKEIDNVPQDISDRIEKLKEKKIQEALEREEKRKNKFKRDT
ncbi:hypothetical protein EKJ_21300 [Qipengyuania flava]|uniref:Uncharacterized protein n=2 Tax=Qipengyuania flava TaxID=192812 RepID=A0A3T1CK33_9SPHN|nr:hypothetical protein EKJ_21300 [Qipengyuania flava]